MTVVDLVPAGTSQGDAGDRGRRPDPQPTARRFDIQVGGPAAELVDVKDKLGARLPLAGADGRAWPPWSCCS